MARMVTLRTWDSTPKNTRSLKLVTKLSDLGSADGTKTILGAYINTIMKKNWATTSPQGYEFALEMRTGTSQDFFQLCLFQNVVNLKTGTHYSEVMFQSPVKNIHQVQLRILGNYIKGDISINDFGLIYITKRTSSEGVGGDE